MKKLLIVLFSLSVALGASAQKYGYGHPRGGFYSARPRVSIGIGAFASPFYGYYGNPYYYSSPFYQPYYHSSRPTKLDLKIEDIKNDYDQKIWGAKHDDNLSRKEKKKEVHELKVERDREILEAKKNYYKY